MSCPDIADGEGVGARRCRRCRGKPDFTNTGRRIVIVQDVGLKLRRDTGNFHQRVVVKIALHHAPVTDRDLLPQRRAETITGATL